MCLVFNPLKKDRLRTGIESGVFISGLQKLEEGQTRRLNVGLLGSLQ